jgi:hypothetical protein
MRWAYEVTATAGARELLVDAHLPPGCPPELTVDNQAEPFVEGAMVEQNQQWVALPARGTSWMLPSCGPGGCHVRYRYRLAEAAKAIDDLDLAGEQGGAFFAPPSTWLLRPLDTSPGGPLSLSVTLPPGVSFFSGWARARPGEDVFEVDLEDLPAAPYSAFGSLPARTLSVPGSTIELVRAAPSFALSDERLASWVAQAGRDVSRYYGHFPVPHLLFVLLPSEGRGVVTGRTLGNGGASIMLLLSPETSESDLARDWVLHHEMIHLAFPTLPRENLWLEEGLSTYVEPIIRARAGRLDERQVWSDFAGSMGQGQPERGDEGLDRTHTWGRTYWGGAIFCLMADVAIRTRTDNRLSLDDALRAVVQAGGQIGKRWSLASTLRVADEATGGTELRDLHHRLGESPERVDLTALFRSLGVLPGGRFDDHAPLARIRQAITRRER